MTSLFSYISFRALHCFYYVILFFFAQLYVRAALQEEERPNCRRWTGREENEHQGRFGISWSIDSRRNGHGHGAWEYWIWRLEFFFFLP